MRSSLGLFVFAAVAACGGVVSRGGASRGNDAASGASNAGGVSGAIGGGSTARAGDAGSVAMCPPDGSSLDAYKAIDDRPCSTVNAYCGQGCALACSCIVEYGNEQIWDCGQPPCIVVEDAGVGADGGASGFAGASGLAGASGSSESGGAGNAGSGGAACSTDCTAPSDCSLVPISCCMCRVPSLSDYTAANTISSNGCRCGGGLCQCLSQNNPNLAATCSGDNKRSGICTGFDVRTVDAYSACQTDADCKLRGGLGCCELCQSSAYDVVAVSINEMALTAALCGDGGQVCEACVPAYPAGTTASCVAGHCQVQ
jgi:hypothetical protein